MPTNHKDNYSYDTLLTSDNSTYSKGTWLEANHLLAHVNKWVGLINK